MLPPYLTDAEVADICAPLVNSAAQYRHLTSKLGLYTARKPNGRPLVARSEFERVLGATRLAGKAETAAAGDLSALRQRWSMKNGTQTQRR